MDLELLLTEEFQQEFLEYLKEDSEFENLNEDILNEGKILNKIRWKLALFSLRFLKENSINDFLRAYYSDKDGKETEKSKEWVAKKKKEKLEKMRELANGMKEEYKQKVINSQAAKMAEKSGLVSFISAGVAAASAGISAYANSQVQKTKELNKDDLKSSKNIYDAAKERDAFMDKHNADAKAAAAEKYPEKYWGNGESRYDTNQINRNAEYNGNKYHIDPFTGVMVDSNGKPVSAVFGGKYSDGSGNIGTVSNDKIGHTHNLEKTFNHFNAIASILASVSNILFGAMWGSIIIAGVSVARGLRQTHKANTARRDEIMADLLKNKDARDLKECLEFLNGDTNSQMSLIEMYQSGDMMFYDVVENIKHQLTLKEELNTNLKKDNKYITFEESIRNADTFLMNIKDAFGEKSKNNVNYGRIFIAGNIEKGSITVGEEVLFKFNNISFKSKVRSIYKFRKQLNTANEGETVALEIINNDFFELVRPPFKGSVTK